MSDKRLHQRLNTFDALLDRYSGKEPFARFLTQYFKDNKQMGSKDRRIAAHLSYTYFRLGSALAGLGAHSRLAIAEFLCEEESDFAGFILPELGAKMALSLKDKIAYLQEHFQFDLESIFPLTERISTEVDQEAFLISHFSQPDLFIRIHTGQQRNVKMILKREDISFSELGEHTLAFANGTKLDMIKGIQGKYEVQDYSSQQTARLFQASAGESWWDACAGSGGKSIPLKQEQPGVELLVSDIRLSILRNLEERFTRAGITDYRKKVIDLTRESGLEEPELFDGIILDVPCSGSGTWGRTPEMLSRFDAKQLDHYVQLQQNIVDHVLAHMKPGKPLIYITCSVYTAENEDRVQYLEGKGLTVEKMEYFKGYSRRGDTLFAARLIRP